MHFKHGLSSTPEYRCWQQIKARCLNPKHRAFDDYGGRGITIHPEWARSFEAFLAYVGKRPSEKHSLDRERVNEGYVPGNVRWATSTEQNNNRRPHRPRGSRPAKPESTGRTTNFKHGMIDSPEYKAWISMKDRCLNPNSDNYPHWGGRGVTVFQEWTEDFTAFFRDVGPKPSPAHSLDRYPNRDGNYEPGNVRWATKREQNLNRRDTVTGSEHGNYEHGHTKSPTYKTWGNVKTKCFNPKADGYASYGGRGITMCARWKSDFEAFFADLGPKPEGKTLNRKNPAGNYSCGACDECKAAGWEMNCQWASATERNRNRRPSERSGKLNPEKVALIHQRLAEGATQPEVAKEFGVGRSLIGKIHRGEVWA